MKPESVNVFLVSGTDEATICAETEKLVRQYAGADPDAFSLDIVREQDGVATSEILNQVVRSVQSPPFLGGRKTVWLQDFSGFALEGAKNSSGPEGAAFRALCDIINNGVPDDIVLIMNGLGADQRKGLAFFDGKGSLADGPDLVLTVVEGCRQVADFQ